MIALAQKLNVKVVDPTEHFGKEVIARPYMIMVSQYTKTDLVFGFTRPRQKKRRPPGLSAIRTGAGERLTGRAGCKPNLGCSYTRSILSRILSENHYEMSIYKDAGGHLTSSYVRDYANYIDVVVDEKPYCSEAAYTPITN